ncbi:glycosyltransferase family 2 protein [Promineifilum sp.]|uniref:glycosyltransferase family 2 protein n=1 Tax=Promineifilum sp. TaxID=2664178 RepID=UPI0035B1464E
MRVSVIIPSLNAPTLSRALNAVLAQSQPADEIIVVGRDEAGALAACPTARFIDTGAPVCAARARNLGMAAATGDLFLLLDADCIPRPDWLAQHAGRQAAGERVVGGAVALQGSNYWAQSDNVSMFHEFVPQHPPGPRFLLPTLNLSVRREVFERAGGLDESFPGAAAEDADWTIRIRRAGYRLYFEPAAMVAHAPARTTRHDVARHWRNLGHNAIRVRLRYADEFGTPRGARRAGWWRALSPLIAARITAGIYADRALWPHWRSLPVVYWTKLLYCLGAARAIDSGFATQP